MQKRAVRARVNAPSLRAMVPYRTPASPGHAGSPPRQNVGLLIAVVVASSVAVLSLVYLFFRGGGLLVPEYAVDVANASRLDAAITSKVAWWSVPATGRRGVVYGIVRGDAGNQVVAVSEATGQFLWRSPLPRELSLASYTRNVGWERPPQERNIREIAPVAPFGAENGASVLFAFDREWIVADGTSGAVVGRGTLPKTIPPFDGLQGVCAQGDGFWVAVQDGRNGGIRVGPNGASTLERMERPSECRGPALFQAQYGVRWSPSAQLRQTSAPPEDCMRTRKNARVATNTCTTFLGETTTGTRLGLAHTEVHYGEGRKAHAFRLAGAKNTYPSVYAVESGRDGALFFAMALHESKTTVHEPPKTSFEPRTTATSAAYVEAIAATGPDGHVRWSASPGASPYLYDTSMLVASDERSPEALLYLYKPGSLTALEQRTGAVRFRFATE